MKRFRCQLRALAVLGLIGFLGFAFNRVISSLTDENRRVMPEISDAGFYFAIAAVASLGYLIYLLARYGRVDVRERRAAYKAAYWALSLLAHSVLALGVAVLIVTAHPDFPLGPALLDEQPSPDGAQVGYLYDYSFFCGYNVFVRHSGDAELRKVASIPRDKCDGKARLHWHDDDTVEVVDAQGEPLVPQHWDLPLMRD